MRKPHHEIERKFLVREMPRALKRYPHDEITQGYLAALAGVHVRVRKKGRVHTLTFKRGPARNREEREIRLSAAQFRVLWPATSGARLTKTRYYIPCGERTIELDVYQGSNAGMIVAEVEFPDKAACDSFTPPAWLGREVTGVKRYGNVGLARD